MPIEVVIGSQSRRLEVAGKMGEDGRIQAFIVGGIPGLALSSSAGIGAIRGKFEAGEAFENSVKSIFAKSTGSNGDRLSLELVDFQQYNIPGMVPRLKAIMSFRAILEPPGQTTLSGYLFDWEGRGLVLLPNQEREMLKEMVNQVLVHWGKSIETHMADNGLNSPVSFPTPKRGEFYGNGVKCTFTIFVGTGENPSLWSSVIALSRRTATLALARLSDISAGKIL